MKWPQTFRPNKDLEEKVEQLKEEPKKKAVSLEDYVPEQRGPGIPEISDTKLDQLYGKIKPVVRDYDSGNLYYIKKVDPRGVAFTWDPKTTKKAKGLERLADIITYHTYGYYGFFKPSIAEVIAQIPELYLNDVVAFETDSDLGVDAIVGDYHKTTTTLYTKK